MAPLNAQEKDFGIIISRAHLQEFWRRLFGRKIKQFSTCILAFHCKALCIINIVVLYEVELLSYIDHKAAEDYDTFTEVSKTGKS